MLESGFRHADTSGTRSNTG